jgi:hypothetical protein
LDERTAIAMTAIRAVESADRAWTTASAEHDRPQWVVHAHPNRVAGRRLNGL